MRRTSWAAALVVAGLSLGASAACGDSAAPETAPSGSVAVDPSGAPAAPTGTACDLLTLDAVVAFMGQPARVDKGDEGECIWLAETNGVFQLHLQLYSGRSFYSPAQWGTAEPVQELGEEAFLVRQAVVGTVAGYWDGQRAVFLNYAKLLGAGASEEKADALVQLLRAVAARLG